MTGDADGVESLLSVTKELVSSKRVRDGLAAVSGAVALSKIVRVAATNLRNSREYTVAISSADDLWDPLNRWLLDQIPGHRRRSVLASTSSGEKKVLGFRYDGDRPQTITIGGHRVRVRIEEEPLGRNVGHGEPQRSVFKPRRLVFRCSSHVARTAVDRWLEDLLAAQANDPNPLMRVGNAWGGWTPVDPARLRPLDTVVLRHGVKEHLLEDLEKFRSSEAEYVRLGVPWHRGYLFEGPPGTGKSSTALALAGHLGMDIYYLPLSDMAEDSNLLSLVSDVTTGGMLLIEDVDTAHSATVRDESASKHTTSMAGLLNLLDGVATPHGLVVVMTTNRLDAIDPAILRPGRADRVVHMGYLDDAQVAEMVRVMLGYTGALPVLDGAEVTPATLTEAVKSHVGDREAGVAEVVRVLEAERVRDGVDETRQLLADDGL